MDNEAPTARLAELFNVNHVILSQANPYLLPFAPKTLLPNAPWLVSRIMNAIAVEIRHRLFQVRSSVLLTG